MRPWYERYFTADYWVYTAVEYTTERNAVEVDYLATVLGDAVPGRRVLDVGCGIGRHAVPLAKRGFDVVGVDVSAWALEHAQAAAQEADVSLRIHQMDALTTLDPADWPVPTVDAVVCVQAFGWGTDAQQLRMLRVLRRLLVPGGVLILDHANVSAILRRYAARSVVSVAGHTFEFRRQYDPLTGRSGGVLRVRRPDGRLAELPDDVRLYQPPEVAALLGTAGFEVLRADADFVVGAPVTMDTRYVQFVACVPGWPVSMFPTTFPATAGQRHGLSTVRTLAPRAHDSPETNALDSSMDGPMDGSGGPGLLDLGRAPDEVEFVDSALTAAWRSVSNTTGDPAGNTAGNSAADALRAWAWRYDEDDPYAASRGVDPLSEHFAVSLWPTQITAGAGATGLLRGLAVLAARDTVLMDPVGHPELALAAGELGATVRAVPFPDPDAAVRAVRSARPAVTVLDRPNVLGQVWPLREVRALASTVTEWGGVLVVDEACASYLPPVESAVALTTGTEVGGLVVVRSMSKGYCCGGLRVGFAVCSPDLADRVRMVCSPLAVSALALDLALALLRQGDVLARLRARVIQVKPRFVALLASAGIDAHAGDPRLPWVTVAGADGLVATGTPGAAVASDAAAAAGAVPGAAAATVAAGAAVMRRVTALGITGRLVPAAPGNPGVLRLSVPLSEHRWRAVEAALSGPR